MRARHLAAFLIGGYGFQLDWVSPDPKPLEPPLPPATPRRVTKRTPAVPATQSSQGNLLP